MLLNDHMNNSTVSESNKQMPPKRHLLQEVIWTKLFLGILEVKFFNDITEPAIQVCSSGSSVA